MSHDIDIVYSPDAVRDLKNLDVSIAKRIIKKVQRNSICSDPLHNAKALTGVLSGKYRYRVGDYRVIFSIGKEGRIQILKILRIKHRKDVYRNL